MDHYKSESVAKRNTECWYTAWGWKGRGCFRALPWSMVMETAISNKKSKCSIDVKFLASPYCILKWTLNQSMNQMYKYSIYNCLSSLMKTLSLCTLHLGPGKWSPAEDPEGCKISWLLIEELELGLPPEGPGKGPSGNDPDGPWRPWLLTEVLEFGLSPKGPGKGSVEKDPEEPNSLRLLREDFKPLISSQWVQSVTQKLLTPSFQVRSTKQWYPQC